VDHFLAIGVEVPGRAVVGGGGEHVVRAEEGDLLPVVFPANHALIVEVHRSAGTLCVCRGAANGQPAEQGQDAVHALSPFHLSLRGDGGTVLGSTPNRSSPPLPGLALRRSRRLSRCYCLCSSSMTLRCGPIHPRIGT